MAAIRAAGRVIVAAVSMATVSPTVSGASTARAPVPDPRTAAVARALEALPLRFESNRGQVDERALFFARGARTTLFLTSSAAVLSVPSDGAGPARAVRMSFAGGGASPVAVGEQELPGRTHYLKGPGVGWKRDLISYARVRYPEMYAGVDVVFYGRERELEFDLVVAAGADPGRIALDIEGAEHAHVEASGDLVMAFGKGEVRLKRPLAYQEAHGVRRFVDSAFVLDGSRVAFTLGEYDRSQTLVIDPVITYSTYFGGNGADYISGIGTDAAGNVYVAGTTNATNFPLAAALDSRLNTSGGFPVPNDAFVSKLNPAGSALIYSTYLGGNSFDEANALAVDAAGHAYVAGRTGSTDFPVTATAFDTSANGTGDAFLAKLAPDGSALLYSTLFGAADDARDVEVDDLGNAYLLGHASGSIPLTAHAYWTATAGSFLSRFNTLSSGAQSLEYSTFAGIVGEQMDVGQDGHVYIAGSGLQVPAVGGFQATPALDAFGRPTTDAGLLRVNPEAASSAEAIVYATYLGGTGVDRAGGISAGAGGLVCLVGTTQSFDFPVRRGLRTGLAGVADAFVAVLDTGQAGEASLVYSTPFGGSRSDEAARCGVGRGGNVHLVGQTTSPDLPLRAPFQPTFNGGEFSPDAFVAEIDPRLDGAASLVGSSYYGGTEPETFVGALHIDAAGGLWIGGATASRDLSLSNAIQTSFRGGQFDAFLAKITTEGGAGGGGGSDLALTSVAPARAGTGLVTVVVHGKGFASGAAVQLRRPGEEVAAASVQLVSDAALQAVFDLSGVAAGSWDVRVAGLDGRSAQLPGGFQVEPRTASIRASVEVVMNPIQRAGRPTHGYITYSNPTNVDVILPIFIYFPRGTTLEFGIPIRHGQSVPGVPQLDFSQIPKVFDTGTEQVMPLIVNVPPGHTGVIPFTIPEGCDPTNPRSIRAATGTPRPTGETMGCALALTSLVLGMLPLAECVGSITSLMMNTIGHFTGAPASLSSWIADLLWASIDCFIAVNPGATFFAAVINITQALMTLDDGAQVLWECGAPIRDVSPGSTATDRSCVASADPNAKYGPVGAGEARHVTGADAMTYVVAFENLPTATAAAQDVVVTDPLDPSRFDLDTFALGPVSFGRRTVSPPPGLSAWVTTVDLRPGVDLLLRIDAGLDRTTNVATWRFTSLDPATGQPTTDPLAGFLPPNVTSPEGEGSVLFTAAPVLTLGTGDVIRNRAKIVFDANAPIDTGEWSNAVDKTAPTSTVAPLSSPQSTASFEVQWSGADGGAGIADYTVFASVNGGPFAAWLSNTTATSASYPGAAGNTYAFFSIARDRVGHTEGAKSAGEAAVDIVLDAEPPVLDLPADIVANAVGPAGASVTYTATATDDSGTASVQCAPASGSMFAIGTTAVSCSATDGSGNSASDTFDVRVLGAEEQIVNLIERVRQMPLSDATRVRLVDALKAALVRPPKVTLVCDVLRLFAALVRAQAGRSIPVPVATELVADANRIRAVLGCGGGSWIRGLRGRTG